MKNDLEERTRRFAAKIIAFVATLPYDRVGEVIRFQLTKAGTAVGANYREAAHAQTRRDFIYKMAIVEKESSEAHYWLQVSDDANLGDVELRTWLLDEADQLVRISASSGRTAKAAEQALAATRRNR